MVAYEILLLITNSGHWGLTENVALLSENFCMLVEALLL